MHLVKSANELNKYNPFLFDQSAGSQNTLIKYPPTRCKIPIPKLWFGLVRFNGISTIVGYLMPNPVFTYILNI